MRAHFDRVARAWQEAVRRFFRGLQWRKDSRSWGLLFAAGLALSRGVLYLAPLNSTDPLPLGLDVVTTVVPLWTFGALWVATATGMAVVAYWRIPVRGLAGLLLAVPVFWTLLYVGTYLATHAPRAGTSAYLLSCYVGMVMVFLLQRPMGGGR